MAESFCDQALRHARSHPQTPCAEVLAMIFLGAQSNVPFLLNQCMAVVELTLPGLIDDAHS
ncbi:hypothetical protein [Variovorax saccharolyticus]|uniref:hypothetical protein n=1 Tax=Variovorax saccharolyticus TaxID=3053516 RepID=UPI0025756482|nr:hypothetical protein [Variovorax sp. J31P216]MDM0029640.1 hypothetical protein [Variovorax sp. J31P216]